MVRDYESLEVLDKHLATLLQLLNNHYFGGDEEEVMATLRGAIFATFETLQKLVDRIGQDRDLGEQGS